MVNAQDERIATLEADARIKAANLELAQARVAELEADAARWSAFRHAVVTEDESFLESLKNYPCLSTPATAAEIDAAIDAAMKDHLTDKQQPVAWAVYKGDECLRVHEKRELAEDWARAEANFGSVGPYHIRELFAAPPAQPDHQGHSCTHKCTWPQCEAAQPAPAQEPQPVSNTDELPQRLSDERIMHFWDIHAGMPTEKYPLNYKDVRAFARAIEAAIVPPGYVVVPVEPTPEIITDGVRALYDASWGDFDAEREEMIATYRAMIAAAQKASHDPR